MPMIFAHLLMFCALFFFCVQYVSIAVNLARDLPRLQSLRASLRPAMLSSPLCDGARFTANLTRTYQHLWERFQRGEAPQPTNRGGN